MVLGSGVQIGEPMRCGDCKSESLSVVTGADGVTRCIDCYLKPAPAPVKPLSTAKAAIVRPAQVDFKRNFKKRAERGVYDG